MNKVIEITRSFETDIETMFDLWTKPELLTQWHRPDIEQFTTPEAEVDLQVGGRYTIVMSNENGRHVVSGEYTEIDRPHTLGYTWQWEGSDDVSDVRIALRKLESGTELTLTHKQIDDEESAKHHEQGWNGCLASLEVVVSKQLVTNQ